MTAQPLSSLRLCSSEPLTDCSFAHPQRCRDVFLLPPLLPQLPGSQAPTFFPILWFVFFRHSSILSGLATHATVYRGCTKSQAARFPVCLLNCGSFCLARRV